jgi:hypothetical protein
MDKGGNLCSDDSTSIVKVSIKDNPSSGTVGPSSYLTATSDSGIVTFTSLQIDKTGSSYVLQFLLYTYYSGTKSYSASSLSALSDSFDVLEGAASQLYVEQTAGGAWAGGQPFVTQPIIYIQVRARVRRLCDVMH